MKIKKQNAGALTNFEVLDFLKSKGASKEASRGIVPIAPSEYKVYDYLVGTPAYNQTRPKIYEFLDKSKKYNLAKAEILNIINVRPSQLVEIDPIIEQAETRLGDSKLEELIELVDQVLPPPLAQPQTEAETEKGSESTRNAKQNDDGENQAVNEK